MRFTLLSVILLIGCDSPSYDGDYLPGLVIHQAIAVVGDSSPQPKPDSDSHTCDNCGGQGWLGDMANKYDCPDCGTVWQIQPNESVPSTVDDQPEPMLTSNAPVFWHDNQQSARDVQGNRTLVVVLTDDEREPCLRLKSNLANPAIESILSESFVCCRSDWKGLGYAEAQPIPKLFFVPPVVAGGDEIPPITPPATVAELIQLLESNR